MKENGMKQPARTRFLILAFVLLIMTGFVGCLSTSKTSIDPDDQFGHRVEGETPDGRRTIVIDPETSDREYRFFPATFQSINVRPASVRSASDQSGVSVEILVKGAFPDACTELHDVEQERAGNIIRVALRVRRPAGAVCASVLRPYRFYLELEGSYAVGAYSLFLNGKSHPFEIRGPADSDA